MEHCDTASMPCPYFEPKTVAESQQVAGRVPLIDEYDGLCRATAVPRAVPSELRFRHCNHGYARGSCGDYPETEGCSCNRYQVTEERGSFLQVVWVEETNYAPVRWRSVRYVSENESLDPDPGDSCARAQLLAFCRSYRRRFPEQTNLEQNR